MIQGCTHADAAEKQKPKRAWSCNTKAQDVVTKVQSRSKRTLTAGGFEVVVPKPVASMGGSSLCSVSARGQSCFYCWVCGGWRSQDATVSGQRLDTCCFCLPGSEPAVQSRSPRLPKHSVASCQKESMSYFPMHKNKRSPEEQQSANRVVPGGAAASRSQSCGRARAADHLALPMASREPGACLAASIPRMGVSRMYVKHRTQHKVTPAGFSGHLQRVGIASVMPAGHSHWHLARKPSSLASRLATESLRQQL